MRAGGGRGVLHQGSVGAEGPPNVGGSPDPRDTWVRKEGVPTKASRVPRVSRVVEPVLLPRQ